MQVGIIGIGLIGGSMAIDLKNEDLPTGLSVWKTIIFMPRQQ